MPTSTVVLAATLAVVTSGPARVVPRAVARACTFPDRTEVHGPTVVSDFPDGLSSDGRGPYLEGVDGVVGSGAGNAAGLTVYGPALPHPRALVVNLDHPVSGGGGTARGTIVDAQSGEGSGLHTQLRYLGDTARNMAAMQVGQVEPAAQMNVTFRIAGKLHLLQMGPQPNGHCHGATAIHGYGTSTGTITRLSPTRWAVDLPAGSVGRLFEIPVDPATNDFDLSRAIDRGLYQFRLHYESGS